MFITNHSTDIRNLNLDDSDFKYNLLNLFRNFDTYDKSQFLANLLVNLDETDKLLIAKQLFTPEVIKQIFAEQFNNKFNEMLK